MGVQRHEPGPLAALQSVLQSIESVRNGRALYLLLLTFAVSGLLLAMAQSALGDGRGWPAALWAGGAFFSVFYGTSAAGLVVMDEALGLPRRHPWDALRDALGLAHRLLVVVATVLLLGAALVAAVAGLVHAARLPLMGPTLMTIAVVVGVPLLGLAGLALVTLVGPIAAPAVWAGQGVGATLRMIGRQVRHRPAHAVMLSAAVSLLTAAVAGLVSAVVMAGGRAVAALAISQAGLDLSLPPFFAALFGNPWHRAVGAPPPSAITAAATTGAGIVFALGLVVPGVVYLRGLCELYKALLALDAGPLDEHGAGAMR